MSRAQLKKYLQGLGETELREVILGLYDARKEAKEYLEFFIDPDIKDTVEKYRKLLTRQYFNSKGRPLKRFPLSEGNRLVKNAVTLGIPPEEACDIMVYNLEDAISWLVMRRSMGQTAWTALINTFRRAADYAFAYGLTEIMKERFDRLMKYSRHAPGHLRVEERLAQEYEEASIYNGKDHEDGLEDSNNPENG